MHLLQQYETDDGPEKPPKQQGVARPYIAIASMEGVLVNQHLGEAARVLIYGKSDGHIVLIESRKTPERGIGIKRWENMSKILSDCRTLLVSGIGPNPKQVLAEHGIEVMVMEGVIEEAVSALFEGRNINHLIKRKRTVCGDGCSDTGGGCG
jgi:nitrogen fixation protein NifB